MVKGKYHFNTRPRNVILKFGLILARGAISCVHMCECYSGTGIYFHGVATRLTSLTLSQIVTSKTVNVKYFKIFA